MAYIGFFVACLLIHNFQMSGAWYFVALIVVAVGQILDVFMMNASNTAILNLYLDKKTGIRGTVQGGKQN